jgi:hypothetical protein
MEPNVPDLKKRERESIRDCICFKLIRISRVVGACLRCNNTSDFYLKKVEFLHMSSDCRLFNKDLYIVNENTNKFELIGANIHFIHNYYKIFSFYR